VNRKQRAQKHAQRRRHQAATRARRGEGAPASVPPGARQITVGKVMPARRRLHNVHDMAAAARGRDDVERAWRRAFKGVMSLGQSGNQPYSRTPVQQMGRQTPKQKREAPSGAQKRRHRGHSQQAMKSGMLAHLQKRMVQDLGQPLALRVQGWTEIAPGHWRRTEGTHG
jgi:hypothetical protein